MIIKELNWLRDMLERHLVIYGKCSALYSFTAPIESNECELTNFAYLHGIVCEIFDDLSRIKAGLSERIVFLDHGNDVNGEKEI